MKRLIFASVYLVALVACSKEQETVLKDEQLNGTETVLATAKDFVMTGMTKTVITQSGSDAPAFAWKEGDIIGIIPMNGKTVQSNFEIAEIGSNPKNAVFDGGVWALKEGKEYAAYYPFRKEALVSNESIEFSFLGQTQSANNSLEHLGAYDYMYASAVAPAAGKAQFDFNHKISLVRLQLTVPKADTYTKVVLESSESWFANGASLKLSDGTMAATETVRSATINLNNIAMTANGVLTVWFATLPTSALGGQTLSVKLFGNENTCTGEITGFAAFTAGSAYSYATTLSSEEQEVEYVDLGLSVKWATCNIGASSIEEYGDYYAWGESETKSDYSKSTYKYYKSITEYVEPIVDEDGFVIDSGGNKTITGYTKYVRKSDAKSYGFNGYFDDMATLSLEDDVAQVKYGGKWRMPTDAEWEELKDNCHWQWVNYKGISGYKVTSKKTGYTDKWIFLPATGYRSGISTNIIGTDCYYWSSALYYDSSNAYFWHFCSEYYYRSNNARYVGMSVRPVCVNMSIHTHTLTKINGQAPTTTSSGWKSYYQCTEPLCKLYFEDVKGEILIGGETELAAWKAEGGRGYRATLIEIVDLGLSVKWRGWNLGATLPEEYGGYYQWAGLEDVKSTSIYLNLSNCPYHTGSIESSGWTKYVPSEKSSYWSGTGSPDNKMLLDPEDDVAHVTLGGNWRMPTYDEWTELKMNCSREWTDDYKGTGIKGLIVTSNKPGYTNKSIFLPVAGYRHDDFLYDVGSSGNYWSSSLNMSSPTYAYMPHFFSGGFSTYSSPRYYGNSVRPVME